MKSKVLILALGLLILSVFLGIEVSAKETISIENKLTIKNKYFKQQEYNLKYPCLNSLQQEYSQNVKGVYVNLWTLSHPAKRKKIIKAITESELNAIVIDLKDIKGRTPFMLNPLKEFSYNVERKELKALISQWQKKGIYVIGRIAVFKDEALASQDSKKSLKYIMDTGQGWSLVDSNEWTNPFSKAVWNYNINIATKMAALGLDEIQFDYIRFPTLRKNSKLVIRNDDKLSRTDAITGFLQEAVKKLNKYNVIVSADLFGLTTTASDDLGIGQNIIKIAQQVDYISPMLYPSHYNEGIYGIENPAASPYQVIANSLADAKEKLGSNSIKIRPWLQDFSLYHVYTKKEIKDQIKAVQDNNLSGWLLWNPKSKYTIEALIPDKKRGSKDES